MGKDLVSLMLCSSFILSHTEGKTTAELEVKFNVLFVSGTNLFSQAAV